MSESGIADFAGPVCIQKKEEKNDSKRVPADITGY